MTCRGTKQAALVVRNIEHIMNQESLEEYIVSEPPGIHLTLGIVSIFISSAVVSLQRDKGLFP
jgi:hypothetical protein